MIYNSIPRRAQALLRVPAEEQIANAIDAVERLGASPELTAAVTALGEAAKHVNNHVDWQLKVALGFAPETSSPPDSAQLQLFEGEDTPSFAELVAHVCDWAHARGILEQSSMQAQFSKTLEELGELVRAARKFDHAGMVDGFGDVLVTLIVAHRLSELELSLEDCLLAALHEISGRTGEMIDGVFVKSDDLCSDAQEA